MLVSIRNLLKTLYGGAEFSYRDLSVPYYADFFGTLDVKDAAWDEYLGRAYLYYTPHEWLALQSGISI